MKRRSKTFWFTVVPLSAAALHLALLCLAAFTMLSYPKGIGSPPWAETLFLFLIWPYGVFYRCNAIGVWIGVGLSFLWLPAVAFCTVMVFMGFRKRN
jgi:hypothetical protein